MLHAGLVRYSLFAFGARETPNVDLLISNI